MVFFSGFPQLDFTLTPFPRPCSSLRAAQAYFLSQHPPRPVRTLPLRSLTSPPNCPPSSHSLFPFLLPSGLLGSELHVCRSFLPQMWRTRRLQMAFHSCPCLSLSRRDCASSAMQSPSKFGFDPSLYDHGLPFSTANSPPLRSTKPGSWARSSLLIACPPRRSPTRFSDFPYSGYFTLLLTPR